ncbi:Tat pathway signal sequence domain protein [Actinoplanes sp. NPDC051633]|uniref:Tat pathway signal sequence domain protein n=1 Tax=Actinoplanes sp. NPDC051633 TaxID=3155670 RepID=UPI003421B725
MRVVRPLVIAAVATLSIAVAGAPALADPEDVHVLTTGSLAGPAVAVGDVLTAAVAEGTTADFFTAAGGSTGIRCAQSAFTSTVVDNPVAPGVATESTTDHTFASCTANIFGVTRVNSVTVNNTPFATTVDSAGVVTVSGTETAPIKTTLSLGTILGSVTCVYTSVNLSITGAVSNEDNSISFAEQPFAKSSGPITCPSSGFFTARYAPVLDTTAEGTPIVFTNLEPETE